MKILMIGNGFDLAHGLRTGYKDFMSFLEFVCDVDRKIKSKNGSVMDWNDDNAKVSVILEPYKKAYRLGRKGGFKTSERTFYKLLLKETEKFFRNWEKSKISILDNLWFIHFKARKAELKERNKWIDFEAEICDVIKEVDNCYDEEADYIKLKTSSTILFEIIKAFEGFEGGRNAASGVKGSKYENLKETLLKDLNGLTNLFEMYLNCIVSEQSTRIVSPDIAGDTINAVISFNYTDNFVRHYEINNPKGKEVTDYVDYIHGEARKRGECNPEENTMILGIDDYLDENECDINTTFIRFKKYFQRIHKKTGNKYKNWLEERSITDEHDLYIFGHSLGMSDRDIIKELIIRERVKTTIYYHNDESYAEKIENLVKIIGKDELIRKVANEDIVFKEQMIMEMNRC